MSQFKTVFITGAGGAIGAHVLAVLLRDTEWKIIATDSFRHKGEQDRIATVINNNQEWRKRLNLVYHDLSAPFTPRQIEKFGKVDYIINLAALSDVQDSIDNPVPFITNNVTSVLNALELARQLKPAAFIQFSTDEVYGPAEAKSTGHSEWDVILPSNPYAASKAAQEAIAISYWRSYDVPVVITNTMNNFGEMQGASKFPALIQKKVTNGEKVQIHCAASGEVGSRYYLHSENTADAVLFILNNTTAYRHKPGHIDWPDRYNLVGDTQLNNLELANKIAELMGKPLDHELVNFHSTNPGHDLHYGLNGKKLAKLGWKAPLSFDESMARVIEWQKGHSEWLK